MPNSTREEKLRWIRPILDRNISIKNMVTVSPFSERSIKYWLKQYRQYGEIGLDNNSTRPRSEPNETPIRTKERVIELRNETNLCALKLKWRLEKEGIYIHERTIGKILKNEGLTRRYRTRKQYPRRTKIELRPGELVEIDIKYVPGRIKSKRYYQFTAIDCSSRWRYLKVYESFSNYDSIDFLEELIKVAPFDIRSIKTDNASNFTNRYVGYPKSTDPQNPRLHPFDISCQRHNIIHYLIDPGKPQQNGKVERSHRSDQESFYDKINYRTEEELKYQIKLYNMYYNDLEHCGLDGKTPNQALKLKVQYVRT